MAKNNSRILLGFEDEIISEKYKGQLNFTVNKIGGKPDYPGDFTLEPPICPLCQLPRPLVVQIYAPLDNSVFHRTLYLFACINPNCWNLNESWLCIRVQTQENIADPTEETTTADIKTSPNDWCADADDWDDNNDNISEENGNVINNVERISDEDEESYSLEDSIRSGFGNLTVDDRNANKGAQGGAVGRLHSPAATAEIEGDEGEVISIDTPTYPQHDIAALLQEATPLPPDVCHSDRRRPSLLQFVPYFVSVWEESGEKYSNTVSDKHVRELMQEYKQKNEASTDLGGPEEGGAAGAGCDSSEKYENSNPAHGDKMFHHFLAKVRANSGQILRYSRESNPLLLYPLAEQPKTCQYCQGDLTFELQIVPTIISKLKLVTDPKQFARLEFGTVLVYTCRKSCWSSDATFRLETVLLQNECY